MTLLNRQKVSYIFIRINTDRVYNLFNTLRPRQDGRYFADDVLKCIFLNENVWISFKIPLKFVPRGPINNISALVQIMAWHRPDDKPLSEPMLVFVPTHICVTRPQWVNTLQPSEAIWGQIWVNIGNILLIVNMWIKYIVKCMDEIFSVEFCFLFSFQIPQKLV